MSFLSGIGNGDEAAELITHDSANDIAGRCVPSRSSTKNDRVEPPRFEEIAAEPLKVGLIPTNMSPSIANQLIEKTRVWQVDSPNFDFYKILSGGRPGGLRPDTPAVGCIRYSMVENGAKLHADMIISVTYNPKTPEILKIAPVRFYYTPNGPRKAAIKVGLSLKTYSLERNFGRLSNSLQNQEMAVEIFDNRGGQAVYQLYDPVSGPSIPVPLPPWDYSSASENPRHNLSALGLTLTEITDFDWLESEIHHLWPSWEYAATDVSKIKLAAQFYGRTHAHDSLEP